MRECINNNNKPTSVAEVAGRKHNKKKKEGNWTMKRNVKIFDITFLLLQMISQVHLLFLRYVFYLLFFSSCWLYSSLPYFAKVICCFYCIFLLQFHSVSIQSYCFLIIILVLFVAVKQVSFSIFTLTSISIETFDLMHNWY